MTNTLSARLRNKPMYTIRESVKTIHAWKRRSRSWLEMTTILHLTLRTERGFYYSSSTDRQIICRWAHGANKSAISQRQCAHVWISWSSKKLSLSMLGEKTRRIPFLLYISRRERIIIYNVRAMDVRHDWMNEWMNEMKCLGKVKKRQSQNKRFHWHGLLSRRVDKIV